MSQTAGTDESLHYLSHIFNLQCIIMHVYQQLNSLLLIYWLYFLLYRYFVSDSASTFLCVWAERSSRRRRRREKEQKVRTEEMINNNTHTISDCFITTFTLKLWTNRTCFCLFSSPTCWELFSRSWSCSSRTVFHQTPAAVLGSFSETAR